MTFPSHALVELPDRVGDGKPFYTSRFRRRAEKVARQQNDARFLQSYRCEVVRENGRWCVVVFQNALKPS